MSSPGNRRSTRLSRKSKIHEKSKIKNTEDVYEIQQILSHKIVQRKHYYLIKWKDYPYEDSTWEPEENLMKAYSYIRQYFQKSDPPEVNSQLNSHQIQKKNDKGKKQRSKSISHKEDEEKGKEKKGQLIITWIPEEEGQQNIVRQFSQVKQDSVYNIITQYFFNE